MAYRDDSDDDYRRELLNDLSLINGAIAALNVPCRVSLEVAELYPTDELPALIAAARHQWLNVLYQMGGTV